MAILNEVIKPALAHIGLSYWLHKDGEAVLVDMPHRALLPGSLIYILHADEKQSDVVITSFMGRIPVARTRQVGIFLLGENSRRKYVSFSMNQRGLITAGVCIDMKLTAHAEEAIITGLFRLMKAVEEAVPGLVKAARLNGKLPLSMLERQVIELTMGLAGEGTTQAPGD